VFGLHRGHHAASAAAVELDLAEAGARAVLRVGDAGTVEGVQAGVEALEATAGRRGVKLFVHSIANASLGQFVGDGATFQPRHFHKTFDSMAHSFAWWVQALVERDLLADNARLLGLTNPLGDSLLANTGLVTAAKAALEIYVRHLAVELGPRGHRVNLLKFGTVITPAVEKVYPPETLARLEALHRRMNPAGRLCTPDEVGRFVALLAGEDVDWFNGATIDFSGGMTLRLMEMVLNER
jgi:NAD(P)-dependent dehydrogenase (short-subunit alcohol dehydrogenase family)